jgi:guanylate kinase
MQSYGTKRKVCKERKNTMLSTETLEHLDHLYKMQSQYQPNTSIVNQLQTKTILLFIGPTCVGKNTVMETAPALDTRYKLVGTFTSREPRSDDTDYTYYENSDEGLRPILDAIEQRHVVQYAVNPYAHTLYGSRIEDYAGDFAMGDVFADAVSQFRQLGFGHVKAISIATEPAVWIQRFNERFPSGHPQRHARYNEALASLQWSLTQTADDHYWIINVDGEPEIAARHVLHIAHGLHDTNTEGRRLAAAMLQTLQEMHL